MIKKNFSLLEVLTALVIVSLITISIGEIFLVVHNSWLNQKNIMEAIKDAYWALNILCYELRQSFTSPLINPTHLSFYLDSNGDQIQDTQIEYWWNTTQLRRRQRSTGGGWGRWEVLIDNLDSFSIQNTTGKFYLIQLGITKGKKNIHFQIGVRRRN